MASQAARATRRPAARSRNFHVPLPAQVYDALKAEASRSGTPATALARQAIELLLRERQRAAVREELATYAARVAGTRDDLDPDLEAAGIEVMLGRRRRSRR
jgi:hypothetical protein